MLIAYARSFPQTVRHKQARDAVLQMHVATSTASHKIIAQSSSHRLVTGLLNFRKYSFLQGWYSESSERLYSYINVPVWKEAVHVHLKCTCRAHSFTERHHFVPLRYPVRAALLENTSVSSEASAHSSNSDLHGFWGLPRQVRTTQTWFRFNQGPSAPSCQAALPKCGPTWVRKHSTQRTLEMLVLCYTSS